MKRPLLVVDCDEVLLHMLVPFRAWLDEAHAIHFDFEHGDFAEALRHKDSGDVVERELVWTLLRAFFMTEMRRQTPIAGAVEAMGRLSEMADVVVLTNIGRERQEARSEQLIACGMDFPVIGNMGGKGEPLAKIMARYDPSVTVFVDDLQENHDSVAAYAPDSWRLHMVGEPEIAPLVKPAEQAHARIDDWTSAERWIIDRFHADLPAP